MTAIVVQFSHVEEFLDEVRRAPPTDRVVRITNRLTPSGTSPTVRRAEVVATYVTAGGTRLVKLVSYVGDLWGRGLEAVGDEEVLAASDKLRATLEAEIAAANLEISSGICTIAGDTVSPFPPAREFSEDLRLVREAFQKVRRTIAAAAGTDACEKQRAGSEPSPASSAWKRNLADDLQQLERTIANLETAETCAPSTILGRIDGTLRKQAHELEILHQCLGRIAAHLEVPGAPVVDEVGS